MEVSRITYGITRIAMDFPSRRKDKRPNKIEIKIKNLDGESQILELSPEEYPPLIPMVEYAEPGILTGNKMDGFGYSLYGYDEKIKSFAQKYNVESFEFSSTFFKSLARLLAKSAYGYSIGIYGLTNIQECFVVPYILDKNKEGIGNFVGCAKDKIINGFQKDHAVRLQVNKEGLILARIKLFAHFNTPEYLVVVGKLKKSAIPSFYKIN